MIAVSGASGQTGGEVTRQLVAKGLPTRALVHNLERARMLSGLNVEIIQADLARPETLEPALAGADKAYFVTSGGVTTLSERFYKRSAPIVAQCTAYGAGASGRQLR